MADELSEENSVRDEFYKIINGYIALHLNKSEELVRVKNIPDFFRTLPQTVIFFYSLSIRNLSHPPPPKILTQGLDADSAVAYRIDVLNKHILNRLQKFVLRLKERGVQGSEMAEILVI